MPSTRTVVRTDNSDIPQKGITFLLIEMNTPGITVDPIIMLTGEHIQNQIFFEDVRVPKVNVVGKVGDGWTVAKYLLLFERGNAYAPRLKGHLDRIHAMARTEQSGSNGPLIENTGFATKLAAAAIAITNIEFTEHRILSELANGGAPGAASSMLKTQATEMSNHLTELALEATGLYIAPFQPHKTSPGGPVLNAPKVSANEHTIGPEHGVTVMPRYLNDRAGPIYAGSNEIQRNIMAKAVLGL